jgi:hypothetical protein
LRLRVERWGIPPQEEERRQLVDGEAVIQTMLSRG